MRSFTLFLASAMLVGGLVAGSAQAADEPKVVERDAPKAQKARLDAGTLGSFTPSGSSRDLDARISELEKRFSFTPSAKAKGGDDLSVGVKRRVARDRTAPTANEVPASRAVSERRPVAAVGAGVDVGYAGFSLSTEYDRTRAPVNGAEREAVEVAVGYADRKWRANVSAASSQPANGNQVVPDTVGESVSVELDGAYALSSRLALRGGVRYDRIHPDAYTRDYVSRAGEDEGKDTGTVYLGGSLRF